MVNLGYLLRKVIVRKAYGYKYHTFRGSQNALSNSLKISKADFCIAKNMLNNLTLKTTEDYVFALSCLTMLGASSKQNPNLTKKEEKISYTFRRLNLYNILSSAIENKVDFTFSCVEDNYTKKPVTLINIAGVQFSMHIDSTSIKKYCEENNLDLYKQEDYNPDFKMQNGAKELFLFCLHLKNLSDTLSGERPLNYYKDLQKIYSLDESRIETDYMESIEKFYAEDFIKRIEQNEENRSFDA